MVADPRVSFVITTRGSHDFIAKTIASIHETARELPAHEIIVSGKLDYLPKEEKIVRVPRPVDPEHPRYEWQAAIDRAQYPWVATVADDDLLGPDWGWTLAAIEDDSDVFWGRVMTARGEERPITMGFGGGTACMAFVARREIFVKHPVMTHWGEDIVWAKETLEAGYKWSRYLGLRWTTYGNHGGPLDSSWGGNGKKPDRSGLNASAAARGWT